MKNPISTLLLIVAFFFNNHSLVAEQLISIFLKPYPDISLKASAEKLAPKLPKPGKLSSNVAKHLFLPSISGIFATYGGFLTVSDLNGEIVFPRKHAKPFVYLLITEKLSPIIMSGNTIHHWELEQDVSAAMFLMEQKFDEDIGVRYWDVTQVPVPENYHVPLESIAIFADPKYVYVPLGLSTLKESPHLLLPDIYIKRGINLTANALFILNLSHYFGSIIPLYKKQPDRYLKQLTY
jgi:hypothetical protein